MCHTVTCYSSLTNGTIDMALPVHALYAQTFQWADIAPINAYPVMPRKYLQKSTVKLYTNTNQRACSFAKNGQQSSKPTTLMPYQLASTSVTYELHYMQRSTPQHTLLVSLLPTFGAAVPDKTGHHQAAVPCARQLHNISRLQEGCRSFEIHHQHSTGWKVLPATLGPSFRSCVILLG
jgi:hypothetical protein